MKLNARALTAHRLSGYIIFYPGLVFYPDIDEYIMSYLGFGTYLIFHMGNADTSSFIRAHNLALIQAMPDTSYFIQAMPDTSYFIQAMPDASSLIQTMPNTSSVSWQCQIHHLLSGTIHHLLSRQCQIHHLLSGTIHHLLSRQCRVLYLLSGQCRRHHHLSGQCRRHHHLSGQCRIHHLLSWQCRVPPLFPRTPGSLFP